MGPVKEKIKNDVCPEHPKANVIGYTTGYRCEECLRLVPP